MSTDSPVSIICNSEKGYCIYQKVDFGLINWRKKSFSNSVYYLISTLLGLLGKEGERGWCSCPSDLACNVSSVLLLSVLHYCPFVDDSVLVTITINKEGIYIYFSGLFSTVQTIGLLLYRIMHDYYFCVPRITSSNGADISTFRNVFLWVLMAEINETNQDRHRWCVNEHKEVAINGKVTQSEYSIDTKQVTRDFTFVTFARGINEIIVWWYETV